MIHNEKDKAIGNVLAITAQMMMEISEVHNNDPVVKEVRLMQCYVILESICKLADVDADVVLERFKDELGKQTRSWTKEVRKMDGEDILNKIFNEKNS